MKLFFTIFAAILAAAAVIYGIDSTRKGAAAEQERSTKLVNSSYETNKKWKHLLHENSDFESYFQTVTFSIPMLEEFVRLRKIDVGSKIEIDLFIKDTEEILAEAKKSEARKNKVAGVEANLKKLKEAMATW